MFLFVDSVPWYVYALIYSFRNNRRAVGFFSILGLLYRVLKYQPTMWVYLMSFFGTVSFCSVYFKVLLGTDTFQIVLWVNAFIIMNCSSFSLVVFLVLKTFSLFHINMLVQPILVSIVMVYLFSFYNQFVFILKHFVQASIQSDNLLIGKYRPFIFNKIISVIRVNSLPFCSFFLFVLSVLCAFSFFPALFEINYF